MEVSTTYSTDETTPQPSRTRRAISRLSSRVCRRALASQGCGVANARFENSRRGSFSEAAADKCAAPYSRRRVSGSDRSEIVLVVLRRGDRICLARRSEQVATSRGLWSVVTGYVEPGVVPLAHARKELVEELGLNSAELSPAPRYAGSTDDPVVQ
jgi:NUDIX domain